MKLYGGIDLHSNNSVVALWDEDDQVVDRQRLCNDAAVIEAALAPWQGNMWGWWWSRPTTGTGWWTP